MSSKTLSPKTNGNSHKTTFRYNPEIARPKVGQEAAEIQPFGTIAKLPNGLSEKVCKESVDRLNQILADTMTLRDMYKKHHWQVAGKTFYQLHLLFDKHYEEQVELVDQIAERIQLLGGLSYAMAADVAENTNIPRPPKGREEVPVQISRLLTAHEIILQGARASAHKAADLGDDGTNDLLVSDVIRTNELQIWFIAEHLVDVPRQRELVAEKFKDYYETLNVPRTASQEDIKHAFRKLAREHHPDLHAEKDKDLHTRKMQEINEAYSVLGSKENRAKYDQFGEHWQNGPPPPPRYSEEPQQAPPFSGQSTEGFSDFFRNMFQQGDLGGERGNLSQNELDIEAVLELSLEEAHRGVEKLFTLTAEGVCPNCHGTGRVKKGFCPVCGGVGEVRQPREVKANIPAGLTENARIRLKSQGSEGPNGRGDLYLRIHLRPDPRFTVDGKNLESEIKVMPWQASLGSEVQVPTLDGPLRIRIPKGTHTGKRLRVAGRGLGKADLRGDLFVLMVIDIPDTLSSKAEALMKQLEDEVHGQVH